jgi:hypothetical protein
MAKQTAEAAGKTGLAKREQAGALAVAYDYGTLSGVGFDNQTNEDISIPFLGVLQPMSPEVTGDDGKGIDGAKAGMLFNTVTNELFDGKDGVIFQPVDTSHVFVEWRPRNQGGGFVAVHTLDSEIVAKAKEDSTEFGKYKHNGNDLIETFYIAGFLLRDGMEQSTMGDPMLIAFTSTKIKIYKQVMTRLRTFAGRPPLFAHRLKITTVQEKNNTGSFSNFKIDAAAGDIKDSLIPPTLDDAAHPLLLAGQEFLKAYRGGLMKVNHEKQGGAAAAGGTAEEPPF